VAIDRAKFQEATKHLKIKPFSPNQLRALAMSNKPFNLWEGAIRSGKTFLSIAWLLNKIKTLPEGNGMILGQTGETIERNFLTDFMNILGDGAFKYAKGRYLDVYYKDEKGNEKTRRMFIIGAKDRGAIGRIRGSTIMLAYIDEATLMPKEVFDELVGRLSYTESTCLITTNPDSPFHWLLKDYVEDEEKNSDWTRHRFTLDDNLALSQTFIDRIKRQYRGLPARYQRMILGLWAVAEGVIYSNFDMKKHVLKKEPPVSPRRLFVGADYGVENPTTFLLIGEYLINRKRFYVVLKEYVYSGRESMKTKTTSQFAEDFADFIQGHRVREVAVDPSAKALIVELNRAEIKRKAGCMYTVIHANNDVLSGIQYVANMIEDETLYVMENCKHTIEEFGVYSWDRKAQSQGVDKVIKENDHCMDGLRYALFTLVRNSAMTSSNSAW
jgi:PBSX family phage terminase large subunit